MGSISLNHFVSSLLGKSSPFLDPQKVRFKMLKHRLQKLDNTRRARWPEGLQALKTTTDATDEDGSDYISPSDNKDVFDYF